MELNSPAASELSAQIRGCEPKPLVPESFELAAARTLRTLRESIRGVLADLPGSPERAQQLADVLGIDLKLAWKMVNVLRHADLYAAGQEVPGAGGLEIFIRAAAKQRVTEQRLAALRSAVRDLEALVRDYAGDRASLDSMLGHLAGRGTERADLAARRAAFKANASIVGVQCRAQTSVFLVYPGSQPGAYSIAAVRGFAGFQRLRADMGWVIARTKYSDDAKESPGEPQRRALDPDAGDTLTQTPLIPLPDGGALARPECKRWRCADGTLVDELQPGSVGRHAATTFFAGEQLTDAGLLAGRDEGEPLLRLGARCHTPAELLQLDVLMHTGLGITSQPRLSLLSELGGADMFSTPMDRHVHVPLCEEAEDLGVGADPLTFPTHVDYAGLLHWVCGRIGHTLDDFRTTRVVVKHPPIPCAAWLEWKLRG